MNKTAFIFALTAGILWGIMGIFSNNIAALGFTSMQVAALRLTTAALAFIIYSLLTNRDSFKVKLRELPLLIFFGISGVMMTSLTYFLSIKYSSMAVAASLMYTAPAIVILSSCLLFKEKMTKFKAFSFIAAFLGGCLVSGIANNSVETTTVLGVIFGLLSGLFYASYSIIGTFVLKKHSSSKATLWAFVFAALSSLLLIDIPDTAASVINCPELFKLLLYISGIGVISSFLPFVLYTASLERTEASKSVIIASVEPLVAALAGFAVFGEAITIYTAVGIILILASVVMTTKS